MLIFTWNIGKNERALDLALTYLERAAASETVLACLQELPNPLPPSIDPLTLASRGLGAAAPVLAQRRALFVHSASIACVGFWDVAQDRMQITRWRLSSGMEFFAAGIHGVDRRNYPILEVRGAYAALTRHALDERWVDGHPLLLLGDFNAWPDLPELSERACLFCSGFLHHMTTVRATRLFSDVRVRHSIASNRLPALRAEPTFTQATRSGAT